MKRLTVLFAVFAGAAVPFSQAAPAPQTSVVVISTAKIPQTMVASPRSPQTVLPHHAVYRVTSIVPTDSHLPAVVESEGDQYTRDGLRECRSRRSVGTQQD